MVSRGYAVLMERELAAAGADLVRLYLAVLRAIAEREAALKDAGER